ncbi:NB-ARC domain-containing protein [Streptomyces sp. NRRL F-5123]|uniref:NB-ARC domain-containing protein n=1 Tax=Streptomyces sp. NRRL F-5123 TaxID=1463856 RepID=UPI000AF938CB|nr:NB-ARC domain-containing protein [Streptomyces sp. NRRL F-5123]
MEPELAALATSGATAFVELLVSEAFERVRRPLARFLRRGSGGAAAAGELQEDSRVALRAREAGDEGALADVRQRWQARLAVIFRDDPGAAAELAGLLSELAPEASRGFVSLVSGGVNYGPAFQGSHIHGGIVFNVRPAATPEPDGRVRPDQVPPVTVPFSNRRAELAALDVALGRPPEGPARVGVGVLEGLPGVGKTATARRWAELARERFPDGQLYVDFAALRDQAAPSGPAGGDVSEALAMCLKSLPGGDRDIPDSVAARTNLFRSRSADLRILLVLDDVTAASQVRALIPKGAGSAVLVTSQGRLAELFLDGGARPIPVGPLDGHGGLALLRDRCGEQTVEAEREAAERLVELCGGLPVALQVAAARLVTGEGLGVAELAAELQEEAGRLAGLSLFGEESPVSVALGPSYRLLPPEAARLYRLLGWLPATDFDAGVASAAAGVDTAAAKRLLGVLVKASLVETVRGGRYRVHDLVRLHARERAVEEEPASAYAELTERVARHYLALAALADRAVRRDRLRVARLDELLRDAADPFAAPGGPAPLEWLDTERAAILAVLRAATAHELYGLVWPLAEAFTVLFLHHRYLGAWQESLELGADAAAQAAARASTAEDVALATAAEARLRSLLSRPLLDLGDTAGAGRELRRAEALAAVSGDLHVHASVLEFLGRYLTPFELSGAVDTLRRCLELNERAGDPRGAALALFFLGRAQHVDGDPAGAMATLLRARDAFAALPEPDPRMAARVGAGIGAVHAHFGEYEDAVRELRAAVRTLEENDAAHYAAQALEQLARVTELAEGRTEQVRAYVRRAREIYAAVGHDRVRSLDRWLEALGE